MDLLQRTLPDSGEEKKQLSQLPCFLEIFDEFSNGNLKKILSEFSGKKFLRGRVERTGDRRRRGNLGKILLKNRFWKIQKKLSSIKTEFQTK